MSYTKKASALIIAMITGVIIISFAGSAVLMSGSDFMQSNRESKKMKARYVAESGSARGAKYLRSCFANSPVSFVDIERFANINLFDQETLYAPHQGQTVKLGDYTVKSRVLKPEELDLPPEVDIVGNEPTSVRYIAMDARGKFSYDGKTNSNVNIQVTYEVGTQAAHVFDYCYFVNNWGRFYSNNIYAIGNVRSNGSFDFGNYRPLVEPKPRFESSDGNDLIGYIDDNGDGQLNNQDGGVYAWDTINGSTANNPKNDLYQGLRGAGTTPEVPQLPMPNLNNLAMYESMSKQQDSSIYIGNVQVCDGILGDDEEIENLYLEGTKTNPIKIKGTIVVHGDVVIRGWVSGQGAIYSARNIYIPQRVLYVNAPGQRQPSTNTESSRENWRETYETNDLLGLFAKEHIVLSDYTDATWQRSVEDWLNHPLNVSKEDAGTDRIPNTKDAGENDGVWTVEKSPTGELIPGTGEDTDGDGVFDDTTKLSDFFLKTSNLSEWAGNIPSGITSFKQLTYWDETTDNPTISTSGVQDFPQVDAVLYTNHFIAGRVDNTSYNYKDGNDDIYYSGGKTQKVIFNGCVICRNDSIIFPTNTDVVIAHDERMSAEDGSRFGFILPVVWKPIKVISMSIRIE